MGSTGPVERAVRAAVREAFAGGETAAGRDRGAVRLALSYAAALDAGECEHCGAGDAGALADLGPKLLQALESLCLTTRARALAAGRLPSSPAGPKSALDQLREERDKRSAGEAP